MEIKQDRRKIKKNLIYGMIGQFITIILGVLLPKLLLENYGSEVNGLLTSVTNIYSYLAVVEAGVAAASCQSLYQAFAKHNNNDINSILAATNNYYHCTGYVYLALVVILSVLYPIGVRTSLPKLSVALIVFLNGIGNVINYFFYGKYLILLKADGKNYIRVAVETISNIFKQLIKIVLIAKGFDIVFVLCIALLTNVVQMVFILCYIKKNYAWIDLTAKPNNEAIGQNRNALALEINYLVTSNTDAVLLTFFSTLKNVSIYSIYALIMGMVDRVLRIVRDAIEFKIAQYFHADRKSFQKFFRAYEVYYITSAYALFTIASYLCLPFMKIYTSGISDAEYLNVYFPYLFACIGILNAARYPMDAMVYIAGHFKQTQNAAIIESTVNLILSIFLVRPYGIMGVLIGTICAAFYRLNYQIKYVNKQIIQRDCWLTYKILLLNSILCVIILYLSCSITREMNSFLDLVVFGIPYSMIVFLVYYLTVSAFEKEAVIYMFKIIINNK